MKDANIQAFICREDRVLHLKNGSSSFISAENFPAWFEKLNQYSINLKPDQPRLIHFLYEAGAFILGNSPRSMPFYAVDTTFESVEAAVISKSDLELKKIDGPNFDDYQKLYEQVQKHLYAGNAYQINLTCPFDYQVSYKDDPAYFNSFMNQPSTGSFAQSIYWPDENMSFVSNSPETLWTARLKKNEMWRIASMPIKGTASSGEWDKLVNSKKDEAELLMITDLVRNDLNRLSDGSAQVDALKEKLEVHGLVHQFSEVSAEVSDQTSIGDIMSSLFPGGSITGAPKKRVGQLIDEIEKSPRGFYCGSTLFWDGSGLSCSINIRSGVVDWNKNKLRLHAGGGVTVQSTAEDEWSELNSKLKSIEDILTKA